MACHKFSIGKLQLKFQTCWTYKKKCRTLSPPFNRIMQSDTGLVMEMDGELFRNN